METIESVAESAPGVEGADLPSGKRVQVDVYGGGRKRVVREVDGVVARRNGRFVECFERMGQRRLASY